VIQLRCAVGGKIRYRFLRQRRCEFGDAFYWIDFSNEGVSIVYNDEGRYDEAAFCLETAALVLPGNAVLNYNAACALARAGRKDPAMDFLQKAVDAGFKDRALASRDPDLDPLRKHPGFQPLLDRMAPGA